MSPFQPSFSQFLVDESVVNLPLTRRVLSLKPDVPVLVLPEGDNPAKTLAEAGVRVNKTVYYLTRPKGRHVKTCPGVTEHYVCCHLTTLDQAENCAMACSYCFLQNYLSESYSVLYVDTAPLLEEIRHTVSQNPGRLFRVCSGELSDSLALDPLTEFSKEAVPLFAGLPNALLELKTKSNCVDNLLGLNHRGKTVVSWSMNPPDLLKNEEPGCASPEERLAAAEAVVKAGYKVGFHFDPLIAHAGMEETYPRLVKDIFSRVAPNRVAWISIGSVRFPPAMKDRLRARYPRSAIPSGEMTRGYDGKWRYIKPIRHALYEIMLGALRQNGAGEVFTYFCMENKDTWARFMKTVPQSNAELDYRFAESLHRRFPEDFPAPARVEDYCA